MNRSILFLALFTFLLVNTSVTNAQSEIGHFAPGVFGIRDFIMPDTGLYAAVYTYRYTTKQLNDKDGNEISSVTVGPGIPINLDLDVAVGAIAPTIVWVSPWKVLGARYGVYFSPAFANTSVGASLSIATGSGRSDNAKQLGLADFFLQPVWLTWTKEHVDFAAAYGFYAPTGKYKTESATLPGGSTITAEEADNIGYGFWTHQFQGAASLYPWADRRMAVAFGLTYELNGKKKDFDLKAGQVLSFNWGISQYLPLKKDQTLLLEIGPAGYSSWQVTDDSGADAINPPVRDSASGIGGQLGVTSVKLNAVLNFHYFYEFAAKDRFQGESIGLNFAIKI